MPLAILLAASWGATLSLEEIAGEVSRGLDFLAADWADIPVRQCSLRATFDYTWRLLDARQQGIFQGLSVFRGAFTRQAARAVCRASPHELRALVERSLLLSTTPGWYELHELLLQYGWEKLARSAQVEQEICNRHCAYYLERLARWDEALKSAKQPEVLVSIDREHENLRTAWSWAAEQGSAAQLAPAVETLCLYYDLRLRYPEGASACRYAAESLGAKTLRADQISTSGLIKILTWEARFQRLLGNQIRADELYADCLNYLDDLTQLGWDDRKERAFLYLEMGNAAQHTDRTAAQRWYRKSLELQTEIADNRGAAGALCGLGEIAQQTGRVNDSIACYEESLTFFRALGDPRSTANSLIGLGNALFRVGRLGEGEGSIGEAIAIFEALGDRAGIARSQLNLARAFFWEGRYAEVLDLFERCSPTIEDLGLKYDHVFILGVSALVLSLLKRYPQAKRNDERLFALCQEIEYPRMLAAGYASLGMAALAEREYLRARDLFQPTLTIYRELDQPDELAAMTGLLGGAYLKIGDLKFAGQCLFEALQVAVKLRAVWAASWVMSWVALFEAERGDLESALEVYSMTENLPIAANSPWYAEVVGEEITAAAGELPPDIITAARERGRELDLWQTAAQLLEEPGLKPPQLPVHPPGS